MPRAAFVALGTFVPDRVVTNEELTRYMETSDAWIQERTGVKERRWVREGTGNSDLALAATNQALERAGWKASDIEAIVYASISSDHMFPGDGCYLNAKLGIPGVPALEVRAVVNEISEPDRGLWRFEDGLALLRAAVPQLLQALDA